VVFTTPAVRALRDRFPDARITYLVEPAAAAVLAGNRTIDELIVVPRARGLAGLRADAALIRRLRREAFDLAIDFHGGPRASMLAWLSAARERIGYDVPGRSWMYTRRVPRSRTPAGGHSVRNQWALLGALGIPPPDPERYPVEMPIEGRAVQAVGARVARAGVDPDDSVVVIHVSAGNPFRRWPATAFAKVASALARGERRRVIITSGPSDGDAASRVIDEARRLLPEADRHRVLAVGDFSLVELRALVERASLYVGGDSGPMHVASTSHVPIVGLYGPTRPERSAPWRAAVWPAVALEVEGLPCRPCDQRRCEPGDFRCLAWIDPQQVIDACERLLGGAAVR